MTAVKIGRITTVSGRPSRIHLALDGVTGCGTRNRARVAYECARPDLAEVKNLCRRCFTPTRVGAAQHLLTSATGFAAERNRKLLADVAQSMTTPEQAAQLDAMAAEIRASLTATGVLTPVDPDLAALMAGTIAVAPAVQALPPAERPRTWAQLRAGNLRTHYQPTAA